MSAPTFEFEVSGDVVERQLLLNGTQIVTLEGESADGGWTLTAGLSWSIRPAARPSEGDITLTAAAGDEIFASLHEGGIREAPASDEADHTLVLRYDIDGGSGSFTGVGGGIEAAGTLAGDAFRLQIAVALGHA
ncbi:MAG: hypothetical protein IVW36_03000 [Dehalococcoidia bacterium]|nr:hypothetical protein [Dehalococcoidia bacterium]